MKKADIQFYKDPDDFVDGNVSYPCDTEYMEYDPLTHRYFLTPAGLQYYQIDAERKYVSDAPNRVEELIKKTTKKVYDTICYKVGARLYPTMQYRIATAPKGICADQYQMRKMFESCLADQARYLVENGDSARYSKYNMESEIEQMPLKPEDQMRDLSDISPETLRTLESLGLTRWFNSGYRRLPDINKY